MNTSGILFSLMICMGFIESVALGADPSLQPSCELTQNVEGEFTAGRARYELHGKCYIGTSYTTWSAIAVYENDRYTESLSVGNGVGTLMGSISSVSRMPCVEDPWLTHTKCEAEIRRIDTAPDQSLSQWLEAHFYPRHNDYNAFSATFNYDRTPLLVKRGADLRAQARRLQRSTLKVPLIVPTILLPTANALFMQNNVVPIKLLPPEGMQVTGFLVKLERLDTHGNWGLVTHVPIGFADATSPTGYTGWGAPGNGRDPSRMVSLPGSYRISAQVSSPRQTLWSTPIPFAVISPNKAIQKAPKMFGQ